MNYEALCANVTPIQTQDINEGPSTDYVEATSQTQPSVPQVDFVSIATPLVERGFRVTPVHPQTKCGVMRNWQKHQATTPAKLKDYAKYFPHHNVGVVCKRGIGRIVVLDIDANGVLEQIECETGQKMPATYTVCSRPQSAAFKRHFYFRQSQYSFEAFGKYHSKNINVQDMNEIDDKGRHPTRYDLKGCGGGAFVVGAGSIRDNGEIYTVIDDLPVAEIPPWLVDWIIGDVKKFKEMKEEERKGKYLSKIADRKKFTPDQRAELRKQNIPAGFDIYERDIYEFLRWRAGSYASLGTRTADIETVLAAQVEDFCMGGKAFVASEKGKATIHRMVTDSTLRKGNASWFYRRKDGKTTIQGTVITPPLPTRHELMVGMIRSLRDEIPSSEAYDFLEDALAKEGIIFNRKSHADQQAAHNARKKAGFSSQNIGGRHVWKKCERVEVHS